MIMNKKIIGIILITIVIVTLVAVGKGLSNNPKKETVVEPVLNIVDELPTQTPQPEEIKTYTDPAGFTFRYPLDVTVVSKKTSDETFYSDIDITSDSHEGNIQIRVKDTTLTTIKDWMKKENFKPLTNEIKKIEFAGLTATQFTDNGKSITAIIDQKILFTISTDLQKDDAFWKNINDTIVSSFVFATTEEKITTLKQNSTPSTDGASDEIDGEVEEIVE